MNVFSLKILALTSMIIDHYGAIFHSSVDIYRIIGRIAFPIYSFLLVEGYIHTKNIKKYAMRLFIFALISEIPFDLAFYNELSFTHQNIFFTLFIGLVIMYFLDNHEKYNLNKTLILALGTFVAAFLSVDYNIIGIIYILSFYYTKDLKKPQRLYKVGIILFIANLMTFYFKQQFSLLALPFLYFYTGELGPKNKFLQMIFYIAYPLHLLIFYLIKTI